MTAKPNPTISRRQFNTLASVTGLAAVAGPLGAQDAAAAPGWIDAHVHVWTDDTQTYPLSPRFKPADMRPSSFTPDELLQHARPAGVQRIVLIQMSFYEFDHRYMMQAMQSHPGVFSAVALIDVHAGDLVQQIDRLASQSVRGFRLASRGDTAGWVSDPAMATLWQTAADRGMAVCPLINPDDIPNVDALCKRFPDTTVVVDHFARVGVSGKIDPTALDNLCRLARFPNVHVKTSAFYALGKKQPPYTDLLPMIRRVVDAFGPQRLMWASDCPYQVQGPHSYEASIALIRDRSDFLSDADRQWILRGTAERVFFA